MDNSYDLIIIGGGPAGLTAGIYTGRQKLKTLLITKNFGGQVAKKAVAIKNYPGFENISGMDLIRHFEKQLRKQKIEIERDETVKISKTQDLFLVLTKSKKTFKAKAVIIASGADPRPLEVPGEKEFIGKGVSYCTSCDAPFFSKKIVAVVGGGNSGFEAAIALSNWAEKIYILEYGESVKADSENQELVEKIGKIEVITGAKMKKIQGSKFVESLTYEDQKSKKDVTLSVGGVFVEIGNQPSTSFAKGLVEFTERDEIKVDFENLQTKTPGLFASGDVNHGKVKQIVTACGEGAKAAIFAFNYIKKLK